MNPDWKPFHKWPVPLKTAQVTKAEKLEGLFPGGRAERSVAPRQGGEQGSSWQLMEAGRSAVLAGADNVLTSTLWLSVRENDCFMQCNLFRMRGCQSYNLSQLVQNDR